VGWLQAFANALSSGWVNWLLTSVVIVFFAYFYTSMVFNPEETADQLRKQGGFIPGVRPGAATAAYIKNVDHVTLPGALFMAVLAVVPSIIFWFTNNTLIQAFGGTSVLIMVGVAMDTIESSSRASSRCTTTRASSSRQSVALGAGRGAGTFFEGGCT
jgi:preprotein translocase subunit SecY